MISYDDQILIDCSGDENSEKTPDTAFLNKKNALLRLVEESPVTKTIVFCNKVLFKIIFLTIILLLCFTSLILCFYFNTV